MRFTCHVCKRRQSNAMYPSERIFCRKCKKSGYMCYECTVYHGCLFRNHKKEVVSCLSREKRLALKLAENSIEEDAIIDGIVAGD